MNMIQRAWIKVLSPVVYLVNGVLAKKGGVIGKFGRFFEFGPRNYGTHTFNNYLKFLNHTFLMMMSGLNHNYSVLRMYGGKMHSAYRPFGLYNLIPQFTFFFIMMLPFAMLERQKAENNSIAEISNWNQSIGTPGNTMSKKVSAHYIEIDNLYMGQMLPRYDEKYKALVVERNKLSAKEKKEIFAVPGYKYELMKNEN